MQSHRIGSSYFPYLSNNCVELEIRSKSEITGQYLRLQISRQEFPKDPLQVFCNETFVSSRRLHLSFGIEK